jgi:CBS domain-containing protein
VKVKSLLTRKAAGVITVTPDQSFCDASKLLVERNIGAVVVVDKAGKLVGILSERDIVRQVAAMGEDAIKLKVGDFMTRDLIIALPDDDLSYVMDTMTEKRIRHLPVMDGKALVGIVSIGDVVKAQRDHFEGEARTLQQYIDGGYA